MFWKMPSRVVWYSRRRHRGLHFSGATRASFASAYTAAVTAERLSTVPPRVMNSGPDAMPRSAA